ncbi:uncharacterized protein LOC131875933 [Cryptomeria japonica]|uniref:uncharacterized protein LOC131875933 n=1 Tax=Cryptomeria japonica TaxID=3369 RepID=UPI0027DA0E81|nr:uncharacterized protein LOC131875933 [Cryptomeria japonica]
MNNVQKYGVMKFLAEKLVENLDENVLYVSKKNVEWCNSIIKQGHEESTKLLKGLTDLIDMMQKDLKCIDIQLMKEGTKGKESLWLTEFDGSCAASGSGAEVVLIPPSGNPIPFSFKLEFKNTNNTNEYEALLLGLAEAKRLGNRVWDEIKDFDAFSIEAIPRELNSKAYSLAVSTSLLVPHPEFVEDIYRVELIYRPSVRDNSDSWQVFENDKQINNFMQSVDMFFAMYFEGSDAECKEFSLEQAKELPDGIMQLKENKIPKGLVSLERLFDRNDAYKNNKGDDKSVY